jgi:hypothetical protein
LLEFKAPSFLKTAVPEGYGQRTAIKLDDIEIPIFSVFIKWLCTPRRLAKQKEEANQAVAERTRQIVVTLPEPRQDARR